MSIPTMHYPASCRDAYHINILYVYSYVIYETPVEPVTTYINIINLDPATRNDFVNDIVNIAGDDIVNIAGD